jgi:hypothetical protein
MSLRELEVAAKARQQAEWDRVSNMIAAMLGFFTLGGEAKQ